MKERGSVDNGCCHFGALPCDKTFVYTPSYSYTPTLLGMLFKNQMATINGEAEVEVIAVGRADANVVLLVGLTIVAHHDTLDVGR